MSIIPTELLHVIINYLTEKEYEPLLKFRTICREWKDIVEHSNVWLRGTLVVCAPKIFGQTFQSIRNYEYQFQIDENITDLQIVYATIIIAKNRYVQLQSQRETTSSVLAQSALAYDVFTRFLQKYRMIHLAWRRFYSFFQFFDYFDQVRDKAQSSTLFKVCVVISIALLGVAAFLISSIPNHPLSLSLSEIFAFVCIYLHLWFCLIIAVVDCLGLLGQYIQEGIGINILQPYEIFLKSSYSDHFIIKIIIFTCFVSFVFLQCSLSSENRIIYTSVSIPLLLSTIIAIFIYLTESSHLTIEILLFLCSIALSILLVGLYYDLPSHGGISSLGLTLIPLFPLVLFLLIGLSSSIVRTILLWRDLIRDVRINFIQQEDYWSRVCIPLSANFFFVSSLVMIFLLFFDLILQAFKDSLSLSQSLTSVVLIILFCQVLLIASKFFP